MKGWFNAFRDNGGPTFYSVNNRTSVTGDVTIITILVIFSTVYTAFLIIFPGIRKEKLSTFITVTLSLFVGCSILVSRYGSSWNVAHTRIDTIYKAFSKEKMLADVGVYVGLSHVNITLKEITLSNVSSDIDYNERFSWKRSNDMTDNYRDGIQRGLPFPILTIAEYFTYREEGFCWGSTYRSAGYFATIMLWSALTLWMFMNIFIMFVPRYGAYFMVLCGALLLATVYGYSKMTFMDPSLVIHLENQVLLFSYGWCFWIVLIAGTMSVVTGALISIIDIMYPNKFSTILEVDYGTPFDRYTIVNENQKNACDNNYQKMGFVQYRNKYS